jgi:hypothetical protein
MRKHEMLTLYGHPAKTWNINGNTCNELDINRRSQKEGVKTATEILSSEEASAMNDN